MIAEVKNILGLLPKPSTERKILVACSGGADSMVLVHVLLSLNENIAIAHCNFNLRGEDSNADEELVRNFALKNKLSFHVESFDTTGFAKHNKISTQVAARELRYEFFKRLKKEFSYDYIAMAHHADDMAETVLINLGRGSGIAGLKGMPVFKNDIIRPLINVSRREIENYATKNSVKYRDDITNFDNKYTRNRIRNEVLPILKEVFPNFLQNVSNSAQLLSSQEVIYDERISDFSKYIKEDNDQISVDLQGFASSKQAAVVLFEFLKEYQFTFSQCENILEDFSKNGKIYHTQTHKSTIWNKNLLIELISAENQQDIFYIEDLFNLTKLPINLEISLFSKDEIADFKANQNEIYIDYSLLKFPLILRRWQNGDRIYPYGLKGSKKLKDVFNDLKINVLEKERAWVLESNGEIVWLVNYKSDRRFAVSENSEQIIKISVC